MSLITTGINAASKTMPKVISPRVHAIIDYATAGTFFLMGGLLWTRHKRAALAAFLCGAAEAGTAMFTDYPGGVKKTISFETHGKLDAGLAGLTAAIPTVLAFGDDAEATFFRGQAVAMAAVTAMTDFENGAQRGGRSRRAA